MKKVIETKKAPAAVGPYSQAIEVNGMVFVSGQIPLNPETGGIVSTEIEEQTKCVMENLSEVLKAADASLENVVKTTIYIKDMNDFSKINEIYAGYFSENPPARATVEVSRLPKDVLVEIDAVAFK